MVRGGHELGDSVHEPGIPADEHATTSRQCAFHDDLRGFGRGGSRDLFEGLIALFGTGLLKFAIGSCAQCNIGCDATRVYAGNSERGAAVFGL